MTSEIQLCYARRVLGVMARLDAGQETETPGLSGHKGPLESNASRGPVDGETGQLGSRGMVPDERSGPVVFLFPPHETPRDHGFSRAATDGTEPVAKITYMNSLVLLDEHVAGEFRKRGMS